MRVQYKDYVDPIVLDKNVTVLVVENPRFLFEFLADLHSDLYDRSSNFIVFENEKKLNTKKSVEWINNVWGLELNDRRLLKTLYKKLENIAIYNGYDAAIINKWSEILEVIEDIILQEENLEINEDIPPIASIMELSGVKFAEREDETFIEKLENYILTRHEYLDTKLFVINNLLFFLEHEGLNELIDFSVREEQNLLFVEYSRSEIDLLRHENVRLIVIDKDQCWLTN